MLALLYQRGAADKKLSLAEYEALGDPARGLNPIQNSVRLAADEAIARVKPGERELAALRDAFVPHLVRVRLDDGKRVRQTARRSDLPPEALGLIGALTEARLLTTRGGADGQQGAPVVEVTHESLFKAWPTLDQWLNEEQTFLTDLERVRDAHENWSKAPDGQKGGELLYGLLLSRAREWLIKFPQRFISRDMEPLRAFIAASAEVADAERARQAERDARAKRIQRWLTIGAVATAAGAVATALVLLVVANYALMQKREAVNARDEAKFERNQANEQRDEANAQRETVLITQSRFLTDLARQSYQAGEYGTAIALAYQALPVVARNRSGRPYVPEAESMLYQAVTKFREQRVFRVDAIAVDKAEISSDGRRVIVTAAESAGVLLNAENGTQIAELHATKPIRFAHFSRDGRAIVSASPDRTAQLWDADGKPSHELPHDSNVSAAAFSYDGRYVATTTTSGAGTVWRTDDGKVHRMLPGSKSATSDAFSPDGHRIVTIGDNGQALIWNLDANRGPSVVLGEPGSASGKLISATFLPDGRRVVTSTDQGQTRIWDAQTGADVTPASLSKPATNVVTEGKWIALDSGDEVSIWDSERLERSQIMKPGKDISVFAISPDGQRIATGSENGIVSMWNIADGEKLAEMRGHKDEIAAAAFSRDGARLITVSRDRTVRVWNGTAGGEVLLVSGKAGRLFPASFSPDSQRIVVSARDNISRRVDQARLAKVWDTATGKQLDLKDLDAPVDALAFAPDGKRIVVGTNDSLFTLDMTADARQVPSGISGSPGRILAISPHRNLIFLGGFSEPFHVWDVSSGKAPVRFTDRADAFAADFSPDNKQIITAWGDARIFDVQAGKQVHVFGDNQQIKSAAFSPDGTTIATGSNDGAIRIWDARTYEMRAEWKPRDPISVSFIAFSPDGRRMVTPDAAGAAIWDIERREHVGVLETKLPIHAAAFSPDGRHIATVFGDYIGIWPVFRTTQELTDRAHELHRAPLDNEQLGRVFLDVRGGILP
jgi:WD40 repeat protein